VLFRDRIETDPVTNATQQTVLGDIVDATPAYIRVPLFSYTDAGYSSFKSANAGRPGALYVAANDGYLHSFDNSTDANGNPLSTAERKTGLHAEVRHARHLPDCGYGLRERAPLHARREPGDRRRVRRRGFGLEDHRRRRRQRRCRGFYALDITDPKNAKGLWEFCSDSTLCPAVGTVSYSDSDLGFSYGNPVIGKRAFDGKWVVVVTSGLNNVSPGTGVGFFYVLDAITGQVLDKVSTERVLRSRRRA